MSETKLEMTKKKSGGAALQDELVFVALGGLGEIGMNVYLYGLGPARDRKWLMVDLGLTFPTDTEPGVDVVLPDITFIEGERRSLVGLVLTHAHEDHLGAVIDMWPRLQCPIYATPFTATMLSTKLAENGRGLKLPITVVPLGHRFEVGPFDLELVTMAHSIPEPSAIAIRTPHGLVFHSGDWKLDATPLVGDPTDEAKLQALGREGITAMICDSTNAMREGRSVSETDVATVIAGLIKDAKRRVAVTTFASNVARVRAVGEAARLAGRQLVVAGRALHRIIAVAKETGYLPDDFVALDQEHFGYLEPSEVVALCTGSQGEPRAAMARIAADDHPHISLGRGDLVIFSSRSIPGNEVGITRVQNGLVRLGCDVITDADALVHVTGHPRREELKTMFDWMKPQLLVPMHGESRHLFEHGKLAGAAGVPQVQPVEDGQMLRLAPTPAMVVDEVPVGRLYRDGNLIVSSKNGPVRERLRLSFAGVVAVAIALDRKGDVAADPEIMLDGVPAETADGEAMEELIYSAVDGTLESMPRPRRRDEERVREAVRRTVRAVVDQAWGKKPIVKVLICLV